MAATSTRPRSPSPNPNPNPDPSPNPNPDLKPNPSSHPIPNQEPFAELLKGSLQTFLNAFTYPDRTCYPVASQNTKDFYNLVNVYLDAVLHPRAKKDETVLAQEGWHYELEDPEAPLTYKGVVFNEMKGVYSSPDSLMYAPAFAWILARMHARAYVALIISSRMCMPM